MEIKKNEITYDITVSSSDLYALMNELDFSPDLQVKMPTVNNFLGMIHRILQ